MKKIKKIFIVLIVMVVACGLLSACENILRDDTDLKAQGYVYRITYDGRGGRMDGAKKLYVYAKEDSIVPEPQDTGRIRNPILFGYNFSRWVYDVADADGNIQQVEWDFEKSKTTPDLFEYNPATGLYELTIYPDWQSKLYYDLVYLGDDGVINVKSTEVTSDLNLDQIFSNANWKGYTQVPGERIIHDDGSITTTMGWYSDESCLPEYEITLPLTEELIPSKEDGRYRVRLYSKWMLGEVDIVNNAKDFASALSSSSSNIYLTGDIDMAGVEIDSVTKSFSGTIRGNGYVVKNLNYSSVVIRGQLNLGLFQELNGATITDLTFENCNLTFQCGVYEIKGLDLGFLAGKLSGESTNKTTLNNITIRDCLIKVENNTSTIVRYGSVKDYNGLFNVYDQATCNVNGILIDNLYFDIK